ncbi:MAG: hypothetical protein QXX19_01915 [Candidatus Caldarchaeum sp.]
MRVLKVSPLKRFVSVVPETTLDLLNLYRVVDVGDVVYSVASRELKRERRDGSVDSERVAVELGVEVSGKRLDPMMKRVDFHGIIKYVSRDLGLEGKHHSIHLGVGDEITIESRSNYPRLEAMAKHYRAPSTSKNTAVVLVDDEGVAVYTASDKGLKPLYRKSVSSRKMEPEERSRMMHKIYGEAVEEAGKTDEIYVFGPSVMVDEFINHVKRLDKQLAGRVKKTGYASSTDFGGVSEVLRNKGLHELREVVKDVADAEEVETLMETLAKDPSRTALGLDECFKAFSMKAVEKLLIAEDYLWTMMTDERVAQMLDQAESYGVDVRVISSPGESLDKLMSLGGVACLLRYSIDPTLLREAG